MKTKLFLLFCILSLVCFLAPAAWAGGKGTVFYMQPNQFDEFQTTAAQLMEKYVTDAGYELKILVAGSQDATLQLNQLDNVILQKPKAIVLHPADPIGIVVGVDKARAAGIPIIAFDNLITETKIDFASVAGSYRMGLLAGEEIARLLKEKHGEVKGSVLDIVPDAQDSYVLNMEEGIQDIMKKYPNVKIAAKVAGNWDATKAADIADDYLIAYPDTDLIYTVGDFLLAAVVPVLESKGIKKGEIIMVSACGMPLALDLIRDGWFQCVVEQPLVAQVEGVAMFLDDVIAKEEIKPGKHMVGGFSAEVFIEPHGPELRIPGTAVTLKNVDDPRLWANQVGK